MEEVFENLQSTEDKKIVFKTCFDASVTSSLNKRALGKIAWLFIVLGVFLCLLGAVSIKGGDVGYGVFLIVLGVIMYPVCIVATKLTQKNVNKTMSIMGSTTEEVYTFTESVFMLVQTKGEDFKGTTEAKYNYFYKIIEDRDNYFLYISKMQCHVLPKNSLVEGSFKDLDEIFFKNLGKNFTPYAAKYDE